MARWRGLPLLGLAALAACSSGGGSQSQPSSPASSTGSGAAASTSVACAIAGAPAFAENCTLERAQVEGAPILVIRHPDGGFRRFSVKDGRLSEADGAERAVIMQNGATLEVSVGADRYRLSSSQLGNAQ